MNQAIPRLWIASSIALGCLVTFTPSQAQIVPDNTLPVNSSVTPGCTICTIEGGTVRGVNLFHSFSEFSVPTGGEANFNNGLQIQNIFSRVTGNSVSNIDGLLRINGTASLFFLNPNGIIFGPNAQLNIGGSFLASTASSFKFPDGSEFSATNPTAPPLLSINVTPGLQWGAARPGETITSRGNLAVGQDLTLAAGNLDLQGQLAAGRDLTLQGQETVKVRDTITRPIIATSARNLTIQGNQIVDILALSHPLSKIGSGGNLNLVSDGNISGDAHFESGGSVSMLTLSGTPGNFVSEFDPIIAANGDVLFGNYTGVALKVETTGSIKGGNIRITGPDTTIPATDPDFATLTGSPSVILRAGLASVNTPNLPQNAGGTGFTATLGLPLGITVGDIDTSSGNGGNGGNIILSAAKGSITSGNLDSSSYFVSGDAGQGGAISLTATNGSISSGNLDSYSRSTFGGAANGGAIRLEAAKDITLAGNLNSSSNGAGNGGNINLVTNGNIITQSLDASTSSGSGGDISLISRNGGINATGELNANSKLISSGNGGRITLQAESDITTIGMSSDGGKLGVSGDITITSDTGTVLVNGGKIESTNYGGKGGDINITATAGSIFLKNGAYLTTSTRGQGNAGNVNIIAQDTVSFDGVSSKGTYSAAYTSVAEGAVGDGGNINITTASLRVSDGAYLTTSTSGQGNAGNVNIVAQDTVSFKGVHSNGDGTVVSSEVNSEDAVGNGGDIKIITGSLFLSDGAQLRTSTTGQGDAGNVTIDARGAVTFDGYWGGAFSTVEETGVGNGGNISITAESLSVTGGAQLLARNNGGRGNAGSVTITADNTVSLAGYEGNPDATVGSDVAGGGIGNGNNVKITARSVFIKDDAIVAASIINGRGKNGEPAQAGNVTITASDTLSVTNSVVFSEVGSTSVGNGGIINIDAPKVFLDNGASLITQVRRGGEGNGGNINITTGSLSATGGSQVVASTFGQGNAGNVMIKASDTVSFDGVGSNRFGINAFTSGDKSNPSGAFSSVEEKGVGNSGGINITTGSLRVTGGALLSARSLGRGNAGSLDVTANSVHLDNGQLSAEIASGSGGNIELKVKDSLFLRDNSLISARAFDTANGGNIKIDTGILIALPPDGANGSDIIAIAQQGSGGKIDIDAAGIFGLEERRAIPGNRTNDIDASSEFGSAGQVTLSTLINPSQGLSPLPTQLVDPSRQIDSRCAARGDNESKFTVTGRGGLPSTPNDLLTSDLVLDDFGTLATANPPTSEPVKPASSSPHKQLVEAQGWIIAADGKVILTALAPSVTPHTPALTPASCQDTQN